MAEAFTDNNADIQPNVGLGGFNIRTHIFEMKEMLWRYEISTIAHIGRTWLSMVGIWEAEYRIENVDIAIDVRNGKIHRLTAHSNYAGSLFGSIRLGMRVSEAMAQDPRIFYSEFDEVLMVNGVPGVTLSVGEPDPIAELLPGMPITAISVIADEAFATDRCVDGTW